MKDFLVTNGNTTYALSTGGGAITSAYDGTKGLSTLTTGCLAFLEDNGTLINQAMPAPTRNKFYIAVGRNGVGTTDGAMASTLIDRGSFKYSKQTGVAAVAMTAVVGRDTGNTAGGFGLPSSAALLAGTYIGYEIGIIVDDTTRLVEDKRRRRRYSYVLTAVDTTCSIAVANLIAVIQARATDPLTVVTCGALVGNADPATNTGYFILTSKTVGSSFRVQGSGLLENSTEHYTAALGATVNNVGSGTCTQVLALEKDYMTHRGRVSDATEFASYWWSEVTNIASTNAPYTLYVITHEFPRVDTLSNNSLPNTQEVVIAVPNAHANTIVWMDTILAAL